MIDEVIEPRKYNATERPKQQNLESKRFYKINIL